ncbi:ectonucleoside triphosphate diphosphohydrolase 7-like protein [Dinothrombium tinctorium]|uniref:Ectonucleoside triphosphate diphosphohydrolase 7-like protein n=1 Tax=Dinothrombium tinctorium TaxID=1965070 RepID=A0A3S3PML7_9ACAR|nr:ectonucleoside triphosphate diphosphohydrolase 7-like protein [Dinothrombium tinctorium]
MNQNCGDVKLSHFLRPFQRLFTGKFRIFVLLTVLAFFLIYVVKMLQSSNSNMELAVNLYEYAENVQNMRYKLHYAVVIDAGSSGSRVHIYTWPPHSGDIRQLLNIKMLKDQFGKDVYEKVSPGLSSCANKPESSINYMLPLLNFAAQHVPVAKHKETPLFILATAGMRLLPLKKQEAILNNLRENIPRNFSFVFSPNYVQVITGKEEGIYSWIAINYLLGKFDHSTSAQPLVAINLNKRITTRPRTVGMLEMGGASMQIAFEIISKYELEELKQRKELHGDVKDLLAEFNLGCLSHDEDHSYLLYVTTYLGLGANVAQEAYTKSLVKEHLSFTSFSTKEPNKHLTVSDPCMVLKSIKNTSIEVEKGFTYEVTLKGTGEWEYCENKLAKLINLEKSIPCDTNFSCPLTRLKETIVSFSTSEFYGFSELWFTMEDVLRLGGQYNYFKFKKAVSEYCKTDWSILQERFRKKLYPLADEERLLTECFKSAWITTVLHKGLRMPKTYKNYKSSLTVNSNQVQWTLGALLYRTRYFPLREIEKQTGVVEQHLSHRIVSSYINHALFLLCMTAVVACIVVYLRHLHQMVNQNIVGRSSVSYTSLLNVKVDTFPIANTRNL